MCICIYLHECIKCIYTYIYMWMHINDLQTWVRTFECNDIWIFFYHHLIISAQEYLYIYKIQVTFHLSFCCSSIFERLYDDVILCTLTVWREIYEVKLVAFYTWISSCLYTWMMIMIGDECTCAHRDINNLWHLIYFYCKQWYQELISIKHLKSRKVHEIRDFECLVDISPWSMLFFLLGLDLIRNSKRFIYTYMYVHTHVC